MTTKKKDPVLVEIQLSGGLDFMNTLIPYTDGRIYDWRPTVSVAAESTISLDDRLAWHPSAGALSELYNAGNVAVIQGVGYENASRSHFRAMDIMHTCEPEKVATEGWLGKVTRELDPNSDSSANIIRAKRLSMSARLDTDSTISACKSSMYSIGGTG